MPTIIEPSFAKGEISPNIRGRVDTEAYKQGLARARNAIVHSYGGVSNRPGTRHIGPVRDHTNGSPRLIPFEFGVSDRYMLEFGDRYMRVIRNDGHVLEGTTTITNIEILTNNHVRVTAAAHGFSNDDEVFITSVGGMTEVNGRRFRVTSVTSNTFILLHQQQINPAGKRWVPPTQIYDWFVQPSGDGYSVVLDDYVNGSAFTAYTTGGTVARVFTLTTPYLQADLDNLKYTQSADIMTLTHRDYQTRDLARTGHTSWTLTALTFAPQTTAPSNVAVGSTAGSEEGTTRYKVTAFDGATGEESLPGLTGVTGTITGITQANPAVITDASHGLASGDEIEISGVVGMTELNGRRFVINVLTSSTFELVGEDSSSHTAYTSGGTWTTTFAVATHKGITGITEANPAVVTCPSHGFSNGDKILIVDVFGMTEIVNRHYWVQNVAASTFELDDESGNRIDTSVTGYSTYQTGGSAIPETVDWTAVAGASGYAIYKAGVNGVYGKVGEATGNEWEDENILPNASVGPPGFRNPFFGAGNYAGVSSYFQQRQVYGGSTNNPDRQDYSRTGERLNFNKSAPLQADDSIQVTLNSREVNEIRHLVPGSDLIVFTSGGEWRISSGQDVAFEAATLRQKIQSEYGSEHIKPIVAGDTILFVERGGLRVRSLRFSLEADRFIGTDLAMLANHLFGTRSPNDPILIDWAWTDTPEPRMYGVRSDGEMVTMTFDQEQRVLAWTTFDTPGDFEHIASLRKDISSVEDAVYVAVQRIVNGKIVRYIERFASRNHTDMKDAIFMDNTVVLDECYAITDIYVDPVTGNIFVDAAGSSFSVGDVIDIDSVEYEEILDETGNPVELTDSLNGKRFTLSNVNTLITGEQSFNVEPENDETIFTTGAAWDINNAITENIRYTLGNNPETARDHEAGTSNNIRGVKFKSDGLSMLVLTRDDGGTEVSGIMQFTLSTAWDIQTASFTRFLDVSTEIDTANRWAGGFDVNPNGDRIIVLGESDNDTEILQEYQLTTEWDLSTATAGDSLDISGPLTAAADVKFGRDGDRAYVLNDDVIHEVALATKYDLTGAALNGVEWDLICLVNNPGLDNFAFKPDGTKFYVVERIASERDVIHQYTLETAWDLGSMTYDSITYAPDGTDVPNGFDTTIDGMDFKPDGKKLWVADDLASDHISEISLVSTRVVNTTPVRKGSGNVCLVKSVWTVDPDLFPLDANVLVSADGHVYEVQLVGNTLTLDRPASHVRVGLRYVTDIELLDPEPAQGTIQGKRKQITGTTVRFYKTRFPLAGPNASTLLPMKQRGLQQELLSEPIKLFTGDAHISIAPEWNSNGRILFRQFEPAPVTIVAVIPDIQVEDID